MIYLFNGIQNVSWIYQPVLQWGASGLFGGEYWQVASWYVNDGSAGQTFHSPGQRVNPGDVLVGVMVLTGQTQTPAGPLFSYNCGFQGLHNTRLPIQNVQELTVCWETLEAYTVTQSCVTQCSDYPGTDRTVFSGIAIATGATNPALTWTAANPYTECGQHATVISNANPGGEVDIFYRTLAVPSAPGQPDRLNANQGLLVNGAIRSQDGRFTLSLQADGNLVLYGPQNQPLWASNTTGHAVWDAVMQGDGNLVVYDKAAIPLWASGTASPPGAVAVVQSDGNLVIYTPAGQPVWASNTVVPPEPAAPAQPDRLASGQGLRPGQVLRSQDGRFTLSLQPDGNLVLYGPQGQPLWASNTAGHAGVWDAVMQGDGNFVVYDIHGQALWASGTASPPGASAVAQSDGNLVIYDPKGGSLWASNTVVPAEPAVPAQPDRLAPGQGLRPGQVLRSQDGRFTLSLQADGNFVVYGIANQPLWASNTAGHAGVWDAVMQGDGNFVVYDIHGHALWASGTAGHPGAWAVMQNDGNLVVYAPGNQPLWASDSVVP